MRAPGEGTLFPAQKLPPKLPGEERLGLAPAEGRLVSTPGEGRTPLPDPKLPPKLPGKSAAPAEVRAPGEGRLVRAPGETAEVLSGYLFVGIRV